jgi:hypothetical protein
MQGWHGGLAQTGGARTQTNAYVLNSRKDDTMTRMVQDFEPANSGSDTISSRPFAQFFDAARAENAPRPVARDAQAPDALEQMFGYWNAEA